MLGERQIGVVFELVRQPLLEQRSLSGRRTGPGARLHVPALPAPLEPTLDRRQRYSEDSCHLFAGHPAIDGVQHLEPEILRVRFHAGSFHKDQLPRNPLYEWRGPSIALPAKEPYEECGNHYQSDKAEGSEQVFLCLVHIVVPFLMSFVPLEAVMNLEYETIA